MTDYDNTNAQDMAELAAELIREINSDKNNSERNGDTE